MPLPDYLDEKHVMFFEDAARDEILVKLVDLLDQSHKLKDRDAFYRAILEREEVVSTGIGMGVALPHAKLHGYKDFFIAVGIHKQGASWDSLDSAPVHVIFMIGGPDDRQTQYLQLLSALTSSIRDEHCRKKLLKAQTATEVIRLIRGVGGANNPS